jgi:hypothetical protein
MYNLRVKLWQEIFFILDATAENSSTNPYNIENCRKQLRRDGIVII